VGRETLGLLRLATVEKLQARATQILVSDDRTEGRAMVPSKDGGIPASVPKS